MRLSEFWPAPALRPRISNNHARRRSRSALTGGGFTLIELLVVIAIIAILAAILFPIFAKARSRAQLTHCMNNVHQLAKALVMYSDDNHGSFPSCDTWPGNIWGQQTMSAWPDLQTSQIWSYIKAEKVFRCPAIPARTNPAGLGTISGMPKGRGKDMPAYTMNQALSRQKPDAMPLRDPAECVALIQERADRRTDPTFQPWADNLSADVHDNAAVVAYLDGHSAAKTVPELERERRSYIMIGSERQYRWWPSGYGAINNRYWDPEPSYPE